MRKPWQTNAKFLINLILLLSVLACRLPIKFGGNTQSQGEIVPIGEQVPGVGATDREGRLTFQHTEADYVIEVQTLDAGTQQPVAGITVWSVSKGDRVLIVAIDETSEYAPAATELKESEIGWLVPSSTARPARIAVFAVPLAMIKVVELYQTASAWYEFANQLPDPEYWSEDTRDYCINPEVKQQGVEALISTGFLVMGPSSLLGQADDYVEAIGTVIDQLASEGVTDGILGLMNTQPPAIERWKIHVISGLPYFAEFAGFCLDPLDRSDVQSALRWIDFALSSGDVFPFKAIFTSSVSSQPYLYEEGNGEHTPQVILGELGRRLAVSHPACVGYYHYSGEEPGFEMIRVWSEGWSPAWDVVYSWGPEYDNLHTQNSNVGFSIVAKDGFWEVKHIYFSASQDEFEYVTRGIIMPEFSPCS